MTRQVLGGAALEEMRLAERPAVLTVAGHACRGAQPAAAGRRRACGAHAPRWPTADLAARVVRIEAAESDDAGALTSRHGSWSAPAAAPAAPTGSTTCSS